MATAARTGLVLGKFLPPHRGHMRLIDAARDQVDELTVLVCTIAREPIPGALRAAWMKELYPDVRVIHVDEELPQEPADDVDFWPKWVATIRARMPDGGPDLVFTSEDYGDELAAKLGARHVCVDRARTQVPVSGTAVRERPLTHWAFLPPPVRPYFVRRVLVYGPESCGKSTLAARLGAHYRTTWVPEYARDLLDRKAAAVTADDIPVIARGQLALEDELARAADRVLICDTDCMTTWIYAETYFGSCPAFIVQAARERHYDLTLLCAPDVPHVAEFGRDFAHRRDEMYALFRARLIEKGTPFVDVRGSWDERFTIATRAVDALIAAG